MRTFIFFICLTVSTFSFAQKVAFEGINYNIDAVTKTAVVASKEYQSPDGEPYSLYDGVVEIPKSIKYNDEKYKVTGIGKGAFWKSSVTEVKIPGSVTVIEEQAFIDCDTLIKINIPKSVTSIGAHAFEGCIGLTEINLSNNVTSIGESAFQGCSGLTSITIPKSVTSIGDGAFTATGITSVVVDDKNISYCSVDNVLFTREQTKLLYCPPNFNGAYSIPASVTGIGGDAFYNCTGLTSVTIPGSVTNIGDCAFESCTGLTSVTIPDAVTCIGEGAFFACSGLTSVVIPGSVASLGESAFRECTSLTRVDIESSEVMSRDFTERGSISVIFGEQVREYIIGNSVEKIGKSAFNECTTLESVTIGNSVRTIEEKAFAGCRSLAAITIPNSVTRIGDYAFDGCRSLSSVDIPGSVTSIGKVAFPYHIQKNTRPEICSKFFGLTLGVTTKQQAISTLLDQNVELVLNTRNALYARNLSHDGFYFDSVTFLFYNGIFSQIGFSDGEIGGESQQMGETKYKQLRDHYSLKHEPYEYFFMEPQGYLFDDDVTRLIINRKNLIFGSDEISKLQSKAEKERYREIHPYSDTRIDRTVLGCTLGTSTRKQVIDALGSLNIKVADDCSPDSIVFSGVKHEGVSFSAVTAHFFAGKLVSLNFTKADGLTNNEFSTLKASLDARYSVYNKFDSDDENVYGNVASYDDDVVNIAVLEGKRKYWSSGLSYQDCELRDQSREFDVRSLRGQKYVSPDKQYIVDLFKNLSENDNQ